MRRVYLLWVASLACAELDLKTKTNKKTKYRELAETYESRGNRLRDSLRRPQELPLIGGGLTYDAVQALADRQLVEQAKQLACGVYKAEADAIEKDGGAARLQRARTVPPLPTEDECGDLLRAQYARATVLLVNRWLTSEAAERLKRVDFPTESAAPVPRAVETYSRLRALANPARATWLRVPAPPLYILRAPVTSLRATYARSKLAAESLQDRRDTKVADAIEAEVIDAQLSQANDMGRFAILERIYPEVVQASSEFQHVQKAADEARTALYRLIQRALGTKNATTMTPDTLADRTKQRFGERLQLSKLSKDESQKFLAFIADEDALMKDALVRYRKMKDQAMDARRQLARIDDYVQDVDHIQIYAGFGRSWFDPRLQERAGHECVPAQCPSWLTAVRRYTHTLAAVSMPTEEEPISVLALQNLRRVPLEKGRPVDAQKISERTMAALVS